MNEEDIKLVESLIKEFKTYNDLDGIQDLSPYMKAIKNLINRNKEIEEDYTSVYLKGVYDERDKWKSKVEEKIEELIKEGRHYNANKIEVLQELLEQ